MITETIRDIGQALPSGWAIAKIGEICDLVNGRAFKPSEWSKSGLPIIRIQNLNNKESSFNYCNFSVDGKFIVENGQLLFGWSGTPGTSFGAHIWNGEKAVLNQHIFKVNINEKYLNKKCLMYFINQRISEYIVKAHGTAGLAHITKDKFENSYLSLPPLAEQKRIVSKFEELFTKLDAGIDSLKKAKIQLKRYRQSILVEIFRGGLRDGWKRVKVEDVAEVKLGRQRSPKNRAGKYARKYVRVANVFRDRLDLSDIKEMDFKPDEFPKFCLKKGDLLLCEGQSSELVGRCAMWNEEIPDCCFQNTLIRVRCKNADPRYMLHVFTYAIEAGDFARLATQTVNIAHLGTQRLATYEIPLAPVEEQGRIAAKIDMIFSERDSLDNTMTQLLLKAKSLRQSILSKAFAGRLVPQDPSDESAQKLLERIRERKVMQTLPFQSVLRVKAE